MDGIAEIGHRQGAAPEAAGAGRLTAGIHRLPRADPPLSPPGNVSGGFLLFMAGEETMFITLLA
jgi:hypothetical protein